MAWKKVKALSIGVGKSISKRKIITPKMIANVKLLVDRESITTTKGEGYFLMLFREERDRAFG